MQTARKIAGPPDCSNNVTCPGAWDFDEPEHVYIQGELIDPATLGLEGVPENERIVRIPRSMWQER